MQPNPVRGVGPAGQTDHPKNQPHSIQARCSSQYKVAVSAVRHPNLVPTCVRAGNVGSGFWLCKFLHLGFRNFLEKSLNHTLGRQAFCLRLKIAGNSMPQYGNRHPFDVIDSNGKTTVHRRHSLSTVNKKLSRSGTCPPINKLFDEIRARVVNRPGRSNQSGHVFDDVGADGYRIDKLLQIDNRLRRQDFSCLLYTSPSPRD